MRKTLELFIFLALFILIANFFNYVLKDDYKQYTRLTMNELYNQNKNIDILFIGSSHTYRTFVTEIIDNKLNTNTFNLGTSKQDMLTSYILIKEVLKKNEVKEIYLDIYYDIALMEPYKQRKEFTDIYIVSDYMKPSLNKVNYLLEATPTEYYINNFWPARRYWDKIFDFEYIKNNINKKSTNNYKNFKWDNSINENEFYTEKGFVANNKEYIVDNYFIVPRTHINLNNINPDWNYYLNKIIKLCKKKNIKLLLISSPIPETSILSIDNYCDFYKYIDDIAKKNNIEFLDCNLMKENYLNTEDNLLFQDEHHLNYMGAKIFSNIFAEYINNNLSKDDLFYKSYEDKISNKVPKVYGITTTKDINNNLYRIVSNSDQFEYKITLIENGVEKLIQDYSCNKNFTVDKKQNNEYAIKINIKFNNNINEKEMIIKL